MLKSRIQLTELLILPGIHLQWYWHDAERHRVIQFPFSIFPKLRKFLEVSAKKSSTFAICLKPMHCGKALEKSLEYAVSSTHQLNKWISEKKMWEPFERIFVWDLPTQFGMEMGQNRCAIYKANFKFDYHLPNEPNILCIRPGKSFELSNHIDGPHLFYAPLFNT